MFCHRCGTQVTHDAKFCPKCGQSLSISGSPPVSGAPALPFGVPWATPWTPASGILAHPVRWIGAGWTLVMEDLGSYVLIALIFCLLNSVPLIQGALIAGFHIFTMKKLMGRPARLEDFFKGFNFFVDALVASLLIALFVFCGTLVFIIPGLVIAAMYKFTFLFIVDKRMEFWPAMQASHAVVKNDYLGFTLFLLLAFLVNVLGFCFFVVGLLVTVPATFAAITVAYKEVVGFEPRTAEAA
jgi:uncharacterized membrane protein